MPRHQRLLSRLGGRGLAVALTAAAATACAACGADAGATDEVTPPARIRLDRVASSAPLPFTPFPEFGLLGDDGICILDGYSVQLLCADRGWSDAAIVAREGRGPGQISRTSDLLPTPDGGLAVYDERNRRLSLIEPDLTLSPSAPVPVPLTAVGALTRDSVLMGLAQPFFSATPTQEVRRVDTRSGDVLDPVTLRFDPALMDADTAILFGGVRAPDGRLLVRVTADHRLAFAWYRADGTFDGLLDFPDYGPVYPTERDVERNSEEYRLIFRRPPPEKELRRFRERPLGPIRRSAARHVTQVDSVGRAWLLSTRPSEVGSYLELFRGTEHIGALEIPGRVRAFQIVGSELAALVEQVEPNADGLYPQRVDWYRIVEVRAARSGPGPP